MLATRWAAVAVVLTLSLPAAAATTRVLAARDGATASRDSRSGQVALPAAVLAGGARQVDLVTRPCGTGTAGARPSHGQGVSGTHRENDGPLTARTRTFARPPGSCGANGSRQPGTTGGTTIIIVNGDGNSVVVQQGGRGGSTLWTPDARWRDHRR